MARPGGGVVQNLYTDALKAARLAGFAITVQQQRAMAAALERAARDLEARIGAGAFTGPVAGARAREMERQIRGILAKVQEEIVMRNVAGTRLTVDRLTAIHRSVNTELARYYGQDVGRMVARFDQVPTRALAALYGRPGTAQYFKTLVNRNMTDAYRDLDTIIGAGIAQGSSADRLTRDIATLLRGGAIDGAEYGLRQGAVGGLRSLQSDARRIAVTEINNALREANTQSLQASPIVRAAKWQLSGRHAGLPSSPDECDDLANAQSEPDLPPGYYSPENWPLAPHPYCGCTQGGPVIYHPVQNWPGYKEPTEGPPPEPEPVPEPEPLPPVIEPPILPPVTTVARAFAPVKDMAEAAPRFQATGLQVTETVPLGHGTRGWGKKFTNKAERLATTNAVLEVAEDFKARFPDAPLEGTIIIRKKEGGRAALGWSAPGKRGGIVTESLMSENDLRVRRTTAEYYSSRNEGRKWGVSDYSSAKAVTDSTFRHEAAHRMTFKATERHWADAKKQAGVNRSWFRDNVSVYGATDQWEEIAETFSLWSSKDYKPGTLPAQIEHFMEWLVSRYNRLGETYVAHDWGFSLVK